VGAFDDPAAGTEAGFLLERFGFFAAAADVGGEAELGQQCAYLVVVVGLVETEALRPFGGGLGPGDRDRGERDAGELVVVQVGAVVLDPKRDPLALAEEAPFRPFLALSVGLGPVFARPSGALVITPSIASHSHSIPIVSS
jgi:hypothetical protein